MTIDHALRCAAVATIATLTITGGAGRGPGDEGVGRTPAPASASASASASGTAAGTPTAPPTGAASPTALVQSRIGPLLAPTLALVKAKPGVTFELADTAGGDPVLDASGDLLLATDLEARVHVEDVDGPRSIVLLDGKAYRNTGGPGEDAWKTTDSGKARIEVEELAVHSLLPALGAGVTRLKHLGVVEEAGTSLTHYSFTADTRRTLDTMDLEFDGTPPRTMTGELWVRSDTGVLTRVHMTIDDFRHEVDLSYGVDPTIVAPPL